jgi:hypothetical protein
MATVIADMSMSLDGFIADRNDDVEPLLGSIGMLSVAAHGVSVSGAAGPTTRAVRILSPGAGPRRMSAISSS